MPDTFVEMDDFNGLGRRVNDLALDCAACKSRTQERLTNGDMRMDSHNKDIDKLFDIVDELKAAVNKGIGIMIAINVGLGIVLFLVGKMVH